MRHSPLLHARQGSNTAVPVKRQVDAQGRGVLPHEWNLGAAQGGKNSRDPILREDVLLQRVPQMRAQRKEDADPFAPEYGAETWYQKSSALPAHVRAAAASLDNWKRNPNERRHVRTNRRK